MNRMPLWSMCALIVLTSVAVGSAATFTVTTSGLQFSPINITINVGDTITWVNLNPNHTVTGDAPSDPFCGPSLPPSGSCSVTFNTAGFLRYHCAPHVAFGMTGTVTVVVAPVPPNVVITNPPNNALFAAPASVPIGVFTSDSDGTVTRVQLFTNGVIAANTTVPPFGVTLTNLAAGNYTLRARAIDSQALSATSAPVILRVASLPLLSFNPGSNGPIQLRFNSVTGVNYIVERGVPLTNFSPVVTNTGSGGLLEFSETNGGPSQQTYRVRLQ